MPLRKRDVARTMPVTPALSFFSEPGEAFFTPPERRFSQRRGPVQEPVARMPYFFSKA